MKRPGNRTTHGMRGSDEYRIWRHMRSRCESPTNEAFQRYGGRGIVVCTEWREFPAFYRDMGPRPSKRHSIDRIDNESGYNPENCRWATWTQQQRNRRNNRVVTHTGVTCTLAEHCERLGLKPSTVSQRLNYGATMEQALSVGRLKRGSIQKAPLTVTIERLMK